MKQKNDNFEQQKEHGTKVPSYTHELGDRIATLVSELGGLKDASEYAGVSDETLANWRDGRSKPNFFGMWGLAKATGRSLDWLATGSDLSVAKFPSNSTINNQLLIEALELVEEWLDRNNREMAAAKKAELAIAIYDLASDGEEGEALSINHQQAAQLLRLVVNN